MMEDLVKDVWARICDDRGEHYHCVAVGHLFIGSTLPLFLFAEKNDLCDVLCSDLASV